RITLASRNLVSRVACTSESATPSVPRHATFEMFAARAASFARVSGVPRVTLVTGAAKRLGRFVALRLAAEGADVAIHYGRSAAEAQDAVREIEKLGRRAIAISADLTNVAQIQTLIDQTVRHFHHLDILVNSAANFLETKFGSTTEQSWDASLDT